MKYLILILSLPVLFSCQSDTTNQQDTKGADSSLYTEMVLPLTDSIRQFPNNEGLYFRRALMLFNTDPALAQKDFEKAAQLKPAVTDFWAGAGEAALILERYPQAIAHFQKALEIAPGYPYLQYRLAAAMIDNKQYTSADSLATVLAASAGTRDKAFYLKARIAEDNKDTSQAIQHLTTAIAAGGMQSDYDAVMELGDLLQSRRSAEAITYYKLAAKLDSVNADPLLAMAESYILAGKQADAIVAYKNSILADPDNESAYMALGRINFKQQQWQEAFRYFNMAAKVSPANAEAYYYRAQCHEKLGRKDEAFDDYVKAMSFRKDYPEAKAALDKLKK